MHSHCPSCRRSVAEAKQNPRLKKACTRPKHIRKILRGPKGEPGEPGEDGENGAIGPTGPRGARGFSGIGILGIGRLEVAPLLISPPAFIVDACGVDGTGALNSGPAAFNSAPLSSPLVSPAPPGNFPTYLVTPGGGFVNVSATVEFVEAGCNVTSGLIGFSTTGGPPWTPLGAARFTEIDTDTLSLTAALVPVPTTTQTTFAVLLCGDTTPCSAALTPGSFFQIEYLNTPESFSLLGKSLASRAPTTPAFKLKSSMFSKKKKIVPVPIVSEKETKRA